ncbi:MAG: hypothetical protein HQK52_12245 [Oligoflexia bacterium]|nr:hypothetical protein [Oligoflexia bacterium]
MIHQFKSDRLLHFHSNKDSIEVAKPKIYLKIFTIIFLLFAYYSLSKVIPNRIDSGDTFELHVQSLSLAHLKTIYLDYYKQYLPPTRHKQGTHGHIYSKYGIGLPFLTAVNMKIFKNLHLNKGIEDFTMMQLTSILFFLLASWCGWRLLSDLNPQPHQKWFNLLIIFGYTFSTLATYYSYGWPGNSIEASLLFISFYLFYLALRDDNIRYKTLCWAGVVLGIAGLSRSFAFITAPAFALYLLLTYSQGRFPTLTLIKSKIHPLLKSALYFYLPVMLSIALHFIILRKKMGFWWGNPYAGEHFDSPFLIGFLGSLFWPGKSFIFFSPLVILSIPALWALFKRHRPLFFFSLYLIAAYVILMSKWWAWWSGGDMGQRFWLPILAFMIFPIALLRAKTVKLLALVLIIFGITIQVNLFKQDPRSIWERIYTNHPDFKETAIDQTIKDGRVLEAIKLTFIDMVFFKNL